MSSRFGNLFTMLAFALVFAIVLYSISNLFLSRPTVVEVTDCALISDTVNSGGQTSITFTLKSKDDENAHLIRVEFSSHQLVKFLLGSRELSMKDGIWYYEEMLNPKATHTQLINVRPTLEPGISRLTYRITVVFFVGNEQFYNKNLDLTVQLPQEVKTSEDKALFLKGIFLLFWGPIVVEIFAFVFLYLLPLFRIFFLTPSNVLLLALFIIGYYSYSLFSEVPYSNQDIEKVVIPQAPKEIANLLKKTTRHTNRLINVEIISVLGKKSLIQSRIVERTRKRGINRSSTQIIGYLSKLQTMGIIHSRKGGYEREYSLTEKGNWCYKAVKECFPRKHFWFIIRHYLGSRRLERFPEATSDQPVFARAISKFSFEAAWFLGKSDVQRPEQFWCKCQKAY